MGKIVKMNTGRKNLTEAQKLWELVVSREPQGVPTSEAAIEIYGWNSSENRDKVRDLARTLRKMGIFVYNIGGHYRDCTYNPKLLCLVSQRRTPCSLGTLEALFKIILKAYQSNPDPEIKEELDALKYHINRTIRLILLKYNSPIQTKD
jgi:hypothetical protein